MKKIVLFLAVGLLFAVNANAEDNATNTVSAANEVKNEVANTEAKAGEVIENAGTEETRGAPLEFVGPDEEIDDNNWHYQKMQVINSLQDIDKKIEDAKKNNQPIAELETQKDELIERLDDLDNKILEEGKDEEMIKARAEKKAGNAGMERQKFLVLEQLKDINKRIEDAGDDSNVKKELEVQKDELIKQLDDIDNQILKVDSNGEMAKARAKAKAEAEAEKAKAEAEK